MIDDPLTMYQNDICTMPANIAGIPAISIPCGISNGLPVGLQIMGPHFSDLKIINIAKEFENYTKLNILEKMISDWSQSILSDISRFRSKMMPKSVQNRSQDNRSRGPREKSLKE